MALRREVWDVNLDPVVGREQRGYRPAVIVSHNRFNESGAELVIILPITSSYKKVPWHVRVEPPEGGLDHTSYIKVEDVRSISKERLKHFRGMLDDQTMTEIEERLRFLFDL